MKNIRLIILLVLITTISLSAEAKSHKKDFIAQGVDSLLVKAPQDQEVCFSPTEPCDIKLTKFVESAQRSIDIAIYSINLDQFVHQVLVKSKQIPVRIIVDRSQAKGKSSLVSLLVKAGANIKYGHQRGIFHNKFTIVDNKMIETGSFNYTNHASESNNENQFYTTNPAVVNRYKDQFDRLWNEATEIPNN